MKLTDRSVSPVSRTSVALAACFALLLSAPLRGQDAGAVVGATVAANSRQSATTLSFGGSAGFQLTPLFGIEIEAVAAPSAELGDSDGGGGSYYSLSDSGRFLSAGNGGFLSTGGVPTSISVFLAPTIQSLEERTVFFTTNVRVRLPVGGARVTPFFVAGGGAAHVRRTADFVYPIFPGPLDPRTPIAAPSLRTTTERVVSVSTALALTMGGGFEVAVTRRFAISADLRYYRLLDAVDSNVGRFGGGVRYRF